ALVLRSRVFGVLFGQLGEIRAGANLLQQVLRLGFELGLFGRRLALGHDQNVPDSYPLLGAVRVLVLRVHALQVGIGRVYGLLQLGLVGNQNRQVLFLRRLIVRQ